MKVLNDIVVEERGRKVAPDHRGVETLLAIKLPLDFTGRIDVGFHNGSLTKGKFRVVTGGPIR